MKKKETKKAIGDTPSGILNVTNVTNEIHIKLAWLFCFDLAVFKWFKFHLVNLKPYRLGQSFQGSFNQDTYVAQIHYLQSNLKECTVIFKN